MNTLVPIPAKFMLPVLPKKPGPDPEYEFQLLTTGVVVTDDVVNTPLVILETP
jgi:hypothetical protein